MEEVIRRVLRENGNLAVDIDGVAADADLYECGLTSPSASTSCSASKTSSTSSSPTGSCG
jgi:hypothetical protein